MILQVERLIALLNTVMSGVKQETFSLDDLLQKSDPRTLAVAIQSVLAVLALHSASDKVLLRSKMSPIQNCFLSDPIRLEGRPSRRMGSERKQF